MLLMLFRRKNDLGFTILAWWGSAFKPQASHFQNKSSSKECYSDMLVIDLFRK